MTNIKKFIYAISVLTAVAMVVSCGGGNSSSTTSTTNSNSSFTVTASGY